MQRLFAYIRPQTQRDPVFPIFALALFSASLVTGTVCALVLAQSCTEPWVPLGVGAVAVFAVLMAARELQYAWGDRPLGFEEIPPQADAGTPSV